MFQAICRELVGLEKANLTVLDLGSGPGFLAIDILDALPEAHVTLLDLSVPMHELARSRLGARARRATFVERNFKESGWSRGLGPYDAIVTNQAVHELRHKRHASGLHAAVKRILRPGGTYLMSDHFFGDGGLQNDQLYMTEAEHREALLNAGFSEVQRRAKEGTLVLYRAT
jgi:16S rRNA G1207 methylase RsmC